MQNSLSINASTGHYVYYTTFSPSQCPAMYASLNKRYIVALKQEKCHGVARRNQVFEQAKNTQVKRTLRSTSRL